MDRVRWVVAVGSVVLLLAVLAGPLGYLWMVGGQSRLGFGAGAGVQRAAVALAAEGRAAPLTMLWAWQEPEDLRGLDPARAGVAFLAATELLGAQLQVEPRQQPLQLAAGTWTMAVVRVEVRPGFRPTRALAVAAAQAAAQAGLQPGVRALQVDFDATATQRDFYAEMLRALQGELERAAQDSGGRPLPVSMTALVSWCGPHSWLSKLPSGPLPVAEAVPMFFRMGGPRATRATAPRDQQRIAEPLCASSIGLATDEVWPPPAPAAGGLRAEERVYLFRPGSWSEKELALLNRFGYQSLKR